MSLISRAIPGLFGGVSQQIPAMRHPTHADEQINALSSLTDGLYKRPGTTLLAPLELDWDTGTPESGRCSVHVIDRPGRPLIGLVFTGSIGTPVRVVNMDTGAPGTITYPDGGALYLASSSPQDSFRFVTVADSTFVVNKGVTVGALGSDGGNWPTNINFVYIRSAPASQLYSIDLPGYGTASYTSGSAFSNITVVAANLITALNGLAGVTANLSTTGGLIIIQTTGPCVATCTDSFSNTTMSSLRLGVEKFSDLPPSAPEGYRVQINGDIENDPYFVEYINAKTRWVETRKYGISQGFTPSTMPMKIFQTGNTSFECRPVQWDQRLVGSDESNPQPSFVGKAIRDIFFFRNRLWFLAGDSCAGSRAGSYYNFFAASTVNVLDTDPVDIGSAVASVDTLDYAVPFNKDMIIWASTKQQFTLAGGDALTPSTARLVPSTGFETDGGASPVQMGNKIVYPFRAKGATQLGLYRASRDLVSNSVEAITDHIPTYMPEYTGELAVTEAFKAVALIPSPPSSKVYLFKYEDDGDDKMTQKAWQQFTIDGATVLKAHWSDSKLYLLLKRIGWTTTKDRLTLETMEFDPTVFLAGAAQPIRLDCLQATSPVVASPTLSYLEILGRHPQDQLVVLSNLNGATKQYTLDSVVYFDTFTRVYIKGAIQAGASAVIGRKYQFTYRFTQAILKDGEGVPIMNAKVKLLKYHLKYEDTGPFTATVAIKNSVSYSYPFNGEGVGILGQLLGTTPTLVSGQFSIPVQAPAEKVTVTLTSDSWMAVRFPYAEWKGNVNMSSKR